MLIVYYSRTGSNRYLADNLAANLGADKAEIRPKGRSFFVQLMLTQMKFGFGLNKFDFDLKQYEKVVLVGPIWTGQLIAPLRSFLKHYEKDITRLYYLTCCGSSDTEKDGKWGYNQVFRNIKEIVGDKCIQCVALPITLVVPDDKIDDEEYIMEARLTDENFIGEIAERFNEFQLNVENSN